MGRGDGRGRVRAAITADLKLGGATGSGDDDDDGDTMIPPPAEISEHAVAPATINSMNLITRLSCHAPHDRDNEQFRPA
jgi:hypothetical protein